MNRLEAAVVALVCTVAVVGIALIIVGIWTSDNRWSLTGWTLTIPGTIVAIVCAAAANGTAEALRRSSGERKQTRRY